MKLKLALERASGSVIDLSIESDATASVGNVADELLAADPRRGHALVNGPVTLAVATGPDRWQTLGRDQQIGEAEFVSGALARVVTATGAAGYPSAAGPVGGGGPATHAAVLHIVGGPDIGRDIGLRYGSSIIGRDASVDCVLNDLQVSRRHARVEVGRQIELVDLNSANGVLLDGGLVTRVTVQPGQVVILGDTSVTITLTTPVVPVASVLTGVGGAIPFNRSPVVRDRYPATEHPRPDVPNEVTSAPFPWLLMIAPLILGAVLFATTRNILSLVFVVVSPLMMSANYFMNRSRQRHALQAQLARFNLQLEALRTTLTTQVPVERQVRNDESPTTTQCVASARTLDAKLWTCRPEHWNYLHLRLATGRTASRNTLSEPKDHANGLPEYEAKLAELVEQFEYIDEVPLVESLALCGALGVAGPLGPARDAARALLAQLVATHSPAEVIVAGIGGVQGAHEFEWLKWLPHTSSPQSPLGAVHLAASAASAGLLVAELEALVDARASAAAGGSYGPLSHELAATARGGSVGGRDESAGPGPVPAVVVLVTDDAPVDRARIVQIAERGSAVGIYTLWVAAQAADLPAVCRTFLELADGVATVHYVRHSVRVPGARVELINRSDALALGRVLCPVLDSSAGITNVSDLPRSISTLGMNGQEWLADPVSIVDRWRQNFSVHDRSGLHRPRTKDGSLRALVGQSGADAMHLDLRAQGPHALVGGTTGSGKSEFLQTWVLGMAAEYSPDRVTFLLIDYKGGAAMEVFNSLPHCVGLFTDLNERLVQRALISLRAEIRHRENLFRRHKVSDILEFERTGDPRCPPALVLVIDEFAFLANEIPDFVDGMVDIAQRGRSLGVHLIMATQRPAGVIRDNLRANTNLRVALRLNDENDSNDVVGSPVASQFPLEIPGRAVARTGPGRLVSFQSAYSSGWTSNEPAPANVIVSELRFGAETLWQAPTVAQEARDRGPNDLARTVVNIGQAATQAAIPTPRRPWLDELALIFDLAELSPETDAKLILGRADQPQEQKQITTYFHPDVDGSLLVYGMGGSGKTTVLRTLAAGSGVTPQGGPVHVYAVDAAGGGLQMIKVLPHVGAVIRGDDSELVLRLFSQLRVMLEERAVRYSAVDADTIVDYRRLADRPKEPRILVLVDGLGSFRDDYAVAGVRGAAFTTLQQLVTEGRPRGIHVVLTADRPASVPGSFGANISRRVVLRMAEDTLYNALDVPDDVLGPGSPRGRAIIDGEEAQIAVFGGSSEVSTQAEKLRQLSHTVHALWPDSKPQPVRSLPTELSIADLPDRVGDQPVLGIGDRDLEAIGFLPEGVFLLSGVPGSGRSNALLALLTSLKRWDPLRPRIYLGDHRSELRASGFWDRTATTPDAVAELAKSLVADLNADQLTSSVIVIENIADFLMPPADAPLLALAKAAKRSNSLLIAEADVAGWSQSYQLMIEIKSARRGLVLQPDTSDGDMILKTTFPRVNRSDFPPGRGLYAFRGRIERVQLPLVTPNTARWGEVPVSESLTVP